jgi:hypothetical protein
MSEMLSRRQCAGCPRYDGGFELRFSIRDSISVSGGAHNEDRLGQHGAVAWVIDGATDLLEDRLLPGASDAAWFAEALDLAFMRRAAQEPAPSLDAVLHGATAEISTSFAAIARRPIVHRHEQPSAAGIFARLLGDQLEALSLGDSTLLTLPGDGAPLDLFRNVGIREADEEARNAAGRLTASGKGTNGIRAELMPMLRAGRDRLNIPGGYGIFSIDLPPEETVRKVARQVRPGDRFLLATDGFLRLVDVYGAYDLGELAGAVRTRGLPASRSNCAISSPAIRTASGFRVPR